MQFFRVGTKDQNGLWYDQAGNFTGLIHNQLNFCKNSELKMDFHGEVSGYLSAATSMEELYNWFPPEDIKRLQEIGYSILLYEANDFKFYDRFQHYLIKQHGSILTAEIKL